MLNKVLLAYLTIQIPADLAGGYYLVRPELLALHQADKSPPNPQFYTGCAQVFLNSTQTKLPSDTVSIPGYVNISDPSVLFNIYEPKWPYPIVGPQAYSSGSSATKDVIPVDKQTEGLLPGNAIVTNANWWATELDPYTSDAGCWNASASCFSQLTACYNTAPPTGDAGCRLWEAKCTDIQSQCNAYDLRLETGSRRSASSPDILDAPAILKSDIAQPTLSISTTAKMGIPTANKREQPHLPGTAVPGQEAPSGVAIPTPPVLTVVSTQIVLQVS